MSEDGFLDAQIDFSLQLLKQLAVDSNVSTVVSPISIVLAMSLAYAGAEGETQKEFNQVFAAGMLKFSINSFRLHTTGQSKEQLHEAFKKLGQFLAPNADRKYTLEAANKIYLDSKFSIKDTYKEVVDQFYSGTFESLDFGAPIEVTRNVNDFVKEKTHDKIKELITPDAISNDTKLVLVNAIYYKVSCVKTLLITLVWFRATGRTNSTKIKRSIKTSL